MRCTGCGTPDVNTSIRIGLGIYIRFCYSCWFKLPSEVREALGALALDL